MRVSLLLVLLAFTLAPQPAALEPFVEIGVWYAGPGVRPPASPTGGVEDLRRDLTAIRRAGFNTVTTWTAWRDAEPKRGTYALAAIERIVAAAVEADLKVRVAAFVDPVPAWSAAPDADRFVEYLGKRFALQPGVIGVQKQAPGQSARGRITVDPGAGPAGRLALWSAIARGERVIALVGAGEPVSATVLSLGETAGVVTRNQALFAPLRPRTSGVTAITGPDAAGRVDVRLLESAETLMIIGLNHAATPKTVTITFAPEIPEAIWQNMETGTAVNFVMGKTGPTLEHTFTPHDAFVLMIRKRLR